MILFISQLLMGPLMVGLGYYFWTNPPKKINKIYGYRTSRSMKSQEAWDYANKYSAFLICLIGIFTCAVQAVAYLMSDQVTAIIAGGAVMTVSLILMMIYVEVQLKEKFDNK